MDKRLRNNKILFVFFALIIGCNNSSNINRIEAQQPNKNTLKVYGYSSNPTKLGVPFWILLLSFGAMTLGGCKRYYAINMVGEDDIDVTYLVKKKHFKPIYNEGKRDEIIYLLNPDPLPIMDEDIKKIKLYLKDKGVVMPTSDTLLREAIQYTSTYFITWYPVDCYDLNIQLEGKSYYLEIRKEADKENEGGRLILPTGDPGSRFIIIDK